MGKTKEGIEKQIKMTQIKLKSEKGYSFLEIVLWYNAEYGTNHFSELFTFTKDARGKIEMSMFKRLLAITIGWTIGNAINFCLNQMHPIVMAINIFLACSTLAMLILGR